MKKIFSINVPNKKPERQLDSIKYEIKKYIGRERRKKTPEDVDFWDFDCQIGESQSDCTSVNANELNSNIDKLISKGLESFYVEILVKPGFKVKSNS
jgi:hypothetical protein